MSLITVAWQSEDFAAQLKRAMAEELDHSIVVWPTDDEECGVDETVESMVAQRPELAILGPCPDVEMALSIAERLDIDHPAISVLIVAEPNAATLERALQIGVRGVIAPNADDEEIRSTVARALAASERRRELAGLDDTDSPRNRVIPVLAAKGGAGKTTTATNLAVALARQFPSDVVIVDLDLQFGDVASAFGFEPKNTFADILTSSSSLNSTSLKTVLTPRQDEGLYVLAAPDTPAQADDISPQVTRRVIEILASEFPYVVVDTSAGIDEYTLEVLDVATDLVLLTSMDVPSVRATKKEIAALEMLGHGSLPCHVVLNRATSKVGISVDDIEMTLGRSVDIRVPSNRSIPMSVNRGKPLSVDDARSTPGRAFHELACRAAGVHEKTDSRLRRRKTR